MGFCGLSEAIMGRRDLLSAEERRRLFGVPVDRDALARLYTFEPRDLELILARREERNQLGFALQLALIRHPGLTLSQVNAQRSRVRTWIRLSASSPGRWICPRTCWPTTRCASRP
jgi:hypothetical protein